MPDKLDIHILDLLQDDIPLVDRPFAVIAKQIGISEQEMIERVNSLSDAGIIRGINPVLEPMKMGICASTLIAIHVPDEKLHEIAEIISRNPAVSHNFQREHHYNIWFTLSGKSKEELHNILSEILINTQITDVDILDLPTVNKLKIDVRFPFLKGNNKEDTHGST